MQTGFIVYRGPSRITNRPIVAILTMHSSNAKTGNMAQLWILSDLTDPVTAIRLGIDADICGECRHRGDHAGRGRSCYVNAGQAPLSIHRSLQAGNYGTEPALALACDALSFAGQRLRLGAYGDPGALPLQVIRRLCAASDGWTGYTHQWKRRPALKAYCMASVDSEAERMLAVSKGWRAFHVLPSDADTGPTGTMECLSDTIGLECRQCRLCAGTSKGAKSIWIRAHGSGAKHHDKRTVAV